jgi:hypothetical protein
VPDLTAFRSSLDGERADDPYRFFGFPQAI